MQILDTQDAPKEEVKDSNPALENLIQTNEDPSLLSEELEMEIQSLSKPDIEIPKLENADSQPSDHSTTGSEISDTQFDPRQNDPNWKNPYELLDYVMEFVNTNNEVLPILAGYFSKFLSCLFMSKKQKICEYLYSHQNTSLENLA